MSNDELKSLKKLLKAVWATVIVNIVLIGGAVWYLGGLEQRVSHLENDDNEIRSGIIDKTSWEYNDYFTRYLWAERWNQPLPSPPYNTRGGLIKKEDG